MWKRATWHECADELSVVCQDFRDAYWGRRHGSGWPKHPDDIANMAKSSEKGVQLLRALALAVRSEQDFDLIPQTMTVVGALKRENATTTDAAEVKQKRGYAQMLSINGYTPLLLRQALNKIAHADPQKADYYIGPGDCVHDLLLYGEDRGNSWFAVVSLIELVKAIRALPDVAIVGAGTNST
jgi:hypothetical protein